MTVQLSYICCGYISNPWFSFFLCGTFFSFNAAFQLLRVGALEFSLFVHVCVYMFAYSAYLCVCACTLICYSSYKDAQMLEHVFVCVFYRVCELYVNLYVDMCYDRAYKLVHTSYTHGRSLMQHWLDLLLISLHFFHGVLCCMGCVCFTVSMCLLSLTALDNPTVGWVLTLLAGRA